MGAAGALGAAFFFSAGAFLGALGLVAFFSFFSAGAFLGALGLVAFFSFFSAGAFLVVAFFLVADALVVCYAWHV